MTAIYGAVFGIGMLVGGLFMAIGMMFADPICIAINHLR